jgi:hypothetical protein
VRNAVIGSGYDNPSCAIACVTDTPVVKPEVVFSKTSPNTSARVGDIISYVVEMDVRNAALNEAVSSIVDNLRSRAGVRGSDAWSGYQLLHQWQGLDTDVGQGNDSGHLPREL